MTQQKFNPQIESGIRLYRAAFNAENPKECAKCALSKAIDLWVESNKLWGDLGTTAFLLSYGLSGESLDKYERVCRIRDKAARRMERREIAILLCKKVLELLN
jgi:hypothetical protein